MGQFSRKIFDATQSHAVILLLCLPKISWFFYVIRILNTSLEILFIIDPRHFIHCWEQVVNPDFALEGNTSIGLKEFNKNIKQTTI